LISRDSPAAVQPEKIRQKVHVKKSYQFVAAALLLVAPALAQQGRVYAEGGNWVQEVQGTLAAARNLRVQVDAGSVRVQGGAQQDITYTISNRAYTSSEEKARQQFNSYKISASVKGDTAWLVGDWQGGRPHKFSGVFVINVPRATQSVKVETTGGSVVTSGIAGRVNVQTGGGQIHMEDIGGSVRAETGGDSIEIGSVGGDLNIQTGGGRVSIGAVKGMINASTGGGDILLVSSDQGAVLEAGGGNIQVKQCAGRLKISTGGGNIDVGDVGGPAEIETGGGSIHLQSAKGPVHAQTGAGRIELDGVPAARAETGAGGIVVKFVGYHGERPDSLLQTSAGDVTVYLPADLKLQVRAAIDLANGHNIRSDFPEIRVRSEGGEWGPRTVTAEGSLNGGGPALKVSTTTGDVWFRRASQ
jgi:DUF4097 and DUF4098 domain-containing protein YvlB